MYKVKRAFKKDFLYYTKIDKDETSTIDFDGGSPTDKNGNAQLPSKNDYTEETTKLQSGATQIFTGDGSTSTFTLTVPVLDGTRIAVFLNGTKQEIDEIWTYASGVVTFKMPPFSGSQVAIDILINNIKIIRVIFTINMLWKKVTQLIILIVMVIS